MDNRYLPATRQSRAPTVAKRAYSEPVKRQLTRAQLKSSFATDLAAIIQAAHSRGADQLIVDAVVGNERRSQYLQNHPTLADELKAELLGYNTTVTTSITERTQALDFVMDHLFKEGMQIITDPDPNWDPMTARRRIQHLLHGGFADLRDYYGFRPTVFDAVLEVLTLGSHSEHLRRRFDEEADLDRLMPR